MAERGLHPFYGRRRNNLTSELLVSEDGLDVAAVLALPALARAGFGGGPELRDGILGRSILRVAVVLAAAMAGQFLVGQEPVTRHNVFPRIDEAVVRHALRTDRLLRFEPFLQVGGVLPVALLPLRVPVAPILAEEVGSRKRELPRDLPEPEADAVERAGDELRGALVPSLVGVGGRRGLLSLRARAGGEVGEYFGPEPEVPAVLLVGSGLRDDVRPRDPSSENRARDSPDAAGPDQPDGLYHHPRFGLGGK